MGMLSLNIFPKNIEDSEHVDSHLDEPEGEDQEKGSPLDRHPGFVADACVLAETVQAHYLMM